MCLQGRAREARLSFARALARCFSRLFSQVLAELGSPLDHMFGTSAIEVADLI